MSAARLTMPLDPARTDADWADDLTFYRSAEADPEDWTGCQASLALVPRFGTSSFLLTSEVGGGLEILANGVGIRVAAAAMSDLVPETYDFELRKLDGTAVETVLVGSVSIEQGLSKIVTGEVATGPVETSGGYGSVKVFRAPGGVRVVRSGGVAGPAGPNTANLIAFNDALTALGVDNVQDAIVALYALIGGGPSPTPQPFYIAAPGFIGVL